MVIFHPLDVANRIAVDQLSHLGVFEDNPHGVEDVILLGVYSHMIAYGLYLPDYPLGHIIAFQIEQYLKDKNLGAEMERMCTLGSIIPDAWMQAALGESISVEPLLKAAEEAVARLSD